MKVLELFSGTGSVGKVCKKLDYEVVSVDMILPADHQVDIMEFNYKQYDKNEFDIIWGSPPCTNYSKLQDCWLGRMRKGEIYTKEIQEKEMNEDDKLVLKTLEIIDYFNCKYWFIENPASSKMKDRPFMKDKPFYLVDYCMYSDWGYKKRTRIWTNKKDFVPKLCDGKGTCGNMITIATDGEIHSGYKTPIKAETRTLHTNCIGDGNKNKAVKKAQHSKILGNGYEMIDGKKVLCNTKELRKLHKTNLGNTERKQKTKGNGTSQKDRYRIPEDLIFSLFLNIVDNKEK